MLFSLTDEEIKENIQYRKVLDNCMSRTQGDLNKIKDYIKKYNNWNEFIVDRHLKYIKDFKNCNYDIRELSKITGIAVTHLLSIFLRIESQFEIYEYKQKDIEHRKKLKEKLLIQQLYSRINPNCGNVKKDEEIRRQIIAIKDKINLLPDYLSKTVNYLIQGKSIDDIVSITGKNKRYLISSIIGTSKPRYPSEMGILKLIQSKEA